MWLQDKDVSVSFLWIGAPKPRKSERSGKRPYKEFVKKIKDVLFNKVGNKEVKKDDD